MNNDIISRSALKEEFAKHEDRKGYLIGDWEEFIDNAPTIEPITNEDIKSAIDEGFKNGYEMAKAKFERPQGEFTIDELKKWLYEIAYNNTNNDFGKYCVEIVDRLNGFKRFVADMRKEAENDTP